MHLLECAAPDFLWVKRTRHVFVFYYVKILILQSLCDFHQLSPRFPANPKHTSLAVRDAIWSTQRNAKQRMFLISKPD